MKSYKHTVTVLLLILGIGRVFGQTSVNAYEKGWHLEDPSTKAYGIKLEQAYAELLHLVPSCPGSAIGTHLARTRSPRLECAPETPPHGHGCHRSHNASMQRTSEIVRSRCCWDYDIQSCFPALRPAWSWLIQHCSAP